MKKLIPILLGVCTFLFILNGGVQTYFKFFPFWKYDKLMHGLLYFSAYLFTFLIVSPYTNKKAVIVGLIWFSVGFLEEVRQSFTHRGFSILDIISNFVGIIVSYYLLKLFYDSRKKANNLSVS